MDLHYICIVLPRYCIAVLDYICSWNSWSFSNSRTCCAQGCWTLAAGPRRPPRLPAPPPPPPTPGTTAVASRWAVAAGPSPSGGRPVQTSCTPCRLCRLFKPFKTTENKTLEFRSREVGDVIRPIKLIGIRKEPVQHGEKGGIFNV